MGETASIPAAMYPKQGIEIVTGGDQTVQRLTSWLPEYRNGGAPVVLAGRILPNEVGATLAGSMGVLCIGPGDWLVVSRGYTDPAVRQEIEPDAQKEGLVLVDLSDGLAGLGLRGSATRELLSKGCGLDLHPGNFPAGRCARTRFAQIPVVVACLDEDFRFELYVGRSYLQYLHDWLTDAAVEFEVVGGCA